MPDRQHRLAAIDVLVVERVGVLGDRAASELSIAARRGDLGRDDRIGDGAKPVNGTSGSEGWSAAAALAVCEPGGPGYATVGSKGMPFSVRGSRVPREIWD